MALGLCVALLAGGLIYGERLERRYIYAITPELGRAKAIETTHGDGITKMEHLKNQGMSLQRKALQRTDLLALYGSSELMKPIPDKASVFFRNYPSGFSVFPVGKAGANSLILLQKIVAADPHAGHHKIAVSVSPSWFISLVEPHYYAGNFSQQQAAALAFSSRLSYGLKEDIARRMLDYPGTLGNDTLLTFALKRLAEDTVWNRFLYALVTPLGLLQNVLFSVQDHFETALYILQQRRHWEPAPEHLPALLNWPALLQRASAQATPLSFSEEPIRRELKIGDDASFRAAMNLSPEWGDLELLLRVLRELGVEPLILSMPPNGSYYEHLGVTPAGLAEYSERLHAIARRYQVPLETFDDHVEDSSFLADHHDHMSVKGWMYFNYVLDAFYHHPSHPLPEEYKDHLSGTGNGRYSRSPR
jgi:D-alanine transfer protein